MSGNFGLIAWLGPVSCLAAWSVEWCRKRFGLHGIVHPDHGGSTAANHFFASFLHLRQMRIVPIIKAGAAANAYAPHTDLLA